MLKEIDVQHPAAKMLVEVSKATDNEVGDGTTSAVILAGALLEKAEGLIDKGVHPTHSHGRLQQGRREGDRNPRRHRGESDPDQQGVARQDRPHEHADQARLEGGTGAGRARSQRGVAGRGEDSGDEAATRSTSTTSRSRRSPAAPWQTRLSSRASSSTRRSSTPGCPRGSRRRR